MEFGFGFGFDSLTELHPAPKDRARLVLAGARELIRSLATERFFLFLHTYKVHRPYEPSAAYRSLYAAAPPPSDAAAAAIPERYRDARDAYDESIGELDALLAELLRDLDASGLSEQTLLVVLSDHGEAFGEHGLPGHGLSPYQEALHVPLVFRGPGVSPGLRIAVPVSLTDVAPTILDLLGLTIPEAMQGRSLRAALAGRALSPRPIYFEWLGGQNRGVRFGNWKLFDGGAPGMVELRSDPLERGPRPVSEASPALTAMLRAYDRDTATRRASLHQPATPTAISPDVDANLRALGYVE
jgi:arylsulfatase A-like enzyme